MMVCDIIVSGVWSILTFDLSSVRAFDYFNLMSSFSYGICEPCNNVKTCMYVYSVSVIHLSYICNIFCQCGPRPPFYCR